METKPGYKTTEFWLTMGVNLGGAANLIGVWDWASNWHSGVLIAIANGAYAFGRGLAKAGVKPTNP